LQDPRVSAKPWRAAGTSASLLVDFGLVATVGWVALGGNNLSGGATRRVRLSVDDPSGQAGEAWDSGTATPGAELGRGQLVHILPTADVTARYLLLDLADTIAPEAGRLWCGPTFRPAANFAFGAADVRKSYSDWRVAQDGTGYGDRRPQQRGFKVSLPKMTTIEKNLYFAPLLEAADVTDDVMFCKDPASDSVARDTVIGTLDALPAIPNQHYDWHAAEFTVWERM
jgi:hypothetical protein